MHCQFFLTLTPDQKKSVRSKLKGHKVKISDKSLEINDLDPKTEILGVFVDSEVNKKVLSKLKKLKLIITLSTGYDHIDLKECKKRKITVCNVPSYGENTVAEFAVMFMLALNRKLFHSIKRVKEGEFDYHGLRGGDIKGKTIGIFGTGKIGTHVLEMLQGFEANIIAFDPFPNKEKAKKLGFTYVSKTKLLKESDIISLHTPLFESTYHMIDAKALKKMKANAFIVNTARGGLIDSEALVMALEKNEIAGAALDVLEGEDYLEDNIKLLSKGCSAKDTRLSLMNNILIAHPNTIITPHNAFNTDEAVKRIIDTSIENLRQFTKGNIQNNVIK